MVNNEHEKKFFGKTPGLIEHLHENQLQSEDYMKLTASAFIFPSMLYAAGKLFYSAVQDLKICFGGQRSATPAKQKTPQPVKKKEEPKNASSQPIYF